MKLIVVSLLCLGIQSAAAPQGPSSDAVSPRYLHRLYELAFKDTPIPDLRSKAGEVSAIRLFCLNDRFPCYAFSILEDGTESPIIEWTEFMAVSKKSGKRIFAESQWRGITESMEVDEFRNLTCADRAVSVGYPYIFMIELFGKGTYRVLYRDNPNYMPSERELLAFNRLIRQIVEASGIDDFQFTLPEDVTEPQLKRGSEQGGADQPATAQKVEPEGNEKSKQEPEARAK